MNTSTPHALCHPPRRLRPPALARVQVPWGPNSQQYEWLLEDLGSLNRSATPWLIVMFHAAPRSTSESHYKGACRVGGGGRLFIGAGRDGVCMMVMGVLCYVCE